MEQKELILVGDRVNIYWENVESEHELEVLHIPVATGDSWILKDTFGRIIYVNSFSKMVRIPKAGKR